MLKTCFNHTEWLNFSPQMIIRCSSIRCSQISLLTSSLKPTKASWTSRCRNLIRPVLSSKFSITNRKSSIRCSNRVFFSERKTNRLKIYSMNNIMLWALSWVWLLSSSKKLLEVGAPKSNLRLLKPLPPSRDKMRTKLLLERMLFPLWKQSSKCIRMESLTSLSMNLKESMKRFRDTSLIRTLMI